MTNVGDDGAGANVRGHDIWAANRGQYWAFTMLKDKKSSGAMLPPLHPIGILLIGGLQCSFKRFHFNLFGSFLNF